jgi:hypothetical protein
MITKAWNNVWKAATEAHRWMMVANALDILSEAYELQTAVPATATLTSEGIYLEISFEGGAVMEILEPDDIAELSPQAYAMLRQAGVIPEANPSFN